MNFGQLIEELKSGNKCCRAGWNGKGMFLFLITDWSFTTDVDGVEDIPAEPFICMKTAGNDLIPWLASQSDVLANDWEVLTSLNTPI